VEPPDESGVAREVGVDDLDGHHPAAGRRGQEHLAHPAGPQPCPQPELADGPMVRGSAAVNDSICDQLPWLTTALLATEALPAR